MNNMVKEHGQYYKIKFNYELKKTDYQSAVRDLIKLIFTWISMTSIKSCDVCMNKNEGEYGGITFYFYTYGYKLKYEDIIRTNLNYNYKLFIDELNIYDEEELFYVINNDKYGKNNRLLSKDKLEYCPYCKAPIFKFSALDQCYDEGLLICKNCHEFVHVNRYNTDK